MLKVQDLSERQLGVGLISPFVPRASRAERIFIPVEFIAQFLQRANRVV
jgi:hypothetical protein